MMSKFLKSNIYLCGRRFTQVGILVLFIIANDYGINILVGNLSASVFLEIIPLADAFAVLQMFTAGAILTGKILIGAVISLLFYGLIAGRGFCAWICPVNMVTDFANYLRRKFNLDKLERKVWLSRDVRYWGIGLVLVLSALNAVPAFEFISPISMMHRGIVYEMGMGFSAILIIFLFDLFGVKNGWCGHICPLGAFYAIVGKYSFYRVRHELAKCTSCMDCKIICPENKVLQIVGKKDGTINSGECINCLRCIEVCPEGALSFGKRQFKKV